MNLLQGMSDSLNIMAFKWRSIRPKIQRLWILLAVGFAIAILLGTAYSGQGLRTVITTAATETESLRDTLLLWVNIFLQDNASTAMGGILWALVASVLLIPLVGYSFASIIPEGDLASIKITDSHKIADSLFLQFVSSISFIQVLTLTALTSILTIDSDNPGIGIVVSWLLWSLSVMATVLSAWFFEFLLRKYGIKAKVIALVLIGIVTSLLYVIFPNDIAGFFGLGEKYSSLIQSLTLNNGFPILAIALVFLAAVIILGSLISYVASNTLKIPEKTKKTDRSKIFLARIGLADKNNIDNMSQFFANMIIRQSNIWKPLLLSTVFAVVMAVVFFAFYEVLFTVSTLIPIMIALVWSINIFGILGSGTTWLVSLPGAKMQLLGSVVKVQYVIIGLITLLIMALVLAFYQPSVGVFSDFLLATVVSSIVITQFALERSVRSPHRYRVHIRGESVLPPNKAFSYMAQLFFLGFAMSGVMYGIGSVPYGMIGLPNLAVIGVLFQLLFLIVVALIARWRFNRLRHAWLYDSDILQNIVKTVGSSN
jgi:hypothetical protein